jgi:phosphonate transport system permease protein
MTRPSPPAHHGDAATTASPPSAQAARLAANEPFRLPARMFDARCKACWFTAGAFVLVALSFWSLDLQWRAFLSREALSSMGRFLAEFVPPDLQPAFLGKVWRGAVETLAMSALGTGLAAVAGLALAVSASRAHSSLEADRQGTPGRSAVLSWRGPIRVLLNFLRSIPELVWAALLLIAAGLGPMAGTLALALHTTGVLGRLFAEALENASPGPAQALRARGVGEVQVFLYARLPQVLPQLLSYTLYRWENNIRAATVLGVVGAGGLGQLLAFHMGLFHMPKTATILIAMLLLVAIVDAASYASRRVMAR